MSVTNGLREGTAEPVPSAVEGAVPKSVGKSGVLTPEVSAMDGSFGLRQVLVGMVAINGLFAASYPRNRGAFHAKTISYIVCGLLNGKCRPGADQRTRITGVNRDSCWIADRWHKRRASQKSTHFRAGK